MEQIRLENIDKTEIVPRKHWGQFVIRFSDDFGLQKNDIIVGVNGTQMKITKVYKYNLWRKILHLFGIKFKLFNCVLVNKIK